MHEIFNKISTKLRLHQWKHFNSIVNKINIEREIEMFNKDQLPSMSCKLKKYSKESFKYL